MNRNNGPLFDLGIVIATAQAALSLVEIFAQALYRTPVRTLEVQDHAECTVQPQVEVVLRERKKEVLTTQPGDSFLYGDRLADDFPLDLFQSKWASRFALQHDDWTAAPGTRSGFAWGEVEDSIPWIALKAAWRQAAPLICLNCDTPTILTNFGQPWTGLLHRTVKFVHVCGTCRRSFRDETLKDVDQWIGANVEPEARPDADMVWDRRVKRELA